MFIINVADFYPTRRTMAMYCVEHGVMAGDTELIELFSRVERGGMTGGRVLNKLFSGV